MMPRLLDTPGVARRVVFFAVLAALIGAALLLTGDGPGADSSRLEATQMPPPSIPLDAGASEALVPGAAGAGLVTTPPGAPAEATASEAADIAAAAAGAVAWAPSVVAPRPAAVKGAALPTVPGATVSGAAAPTTTTPAPVTAVTSTTVVPAQVAAPFPASLAPVPTASSAEVASTTTTSTTPPVAAPRTGGARSAGVEAEVVPLTNTDRRSEGLGPLSRSACLDSMAAGYAEQMARAGVLAHNPAAGPAVTGCVANATWGDNIGTAAPCSATVLEQRWMASPSHRHNIMTGAFQRIGVGAWTDERGSCWVQVLFSS